MEIQNTSSSSYNHPQAQAIQITTSTSLLFTSNSNHNAGNVELLTQINEVGLYQVHKSVITQPLRTKILKELIVTPINLCPSKIKSFCIKPVQLFQETSSHFLLPRHYGKELFGPPMYNFFENSSLYTPASIRPEIQFTGQLTSQQTPIVVLVFNYLREHGGCLLELKCGFGKTVMLIYIFLALGLKPLIIVTSTYLMNQMRDNIRAFCSTSIRIGYIQGNRVETENVDVCIGMIHSLAKIDYPPHTFATFGISIYDEAHHSNSTMFKKCLTKVPTKFTLSVSAQMERKDGMTCISKHHIGPIVFSLKGVNTSGTINVVVKTVEYRMANPPAYDKHSLHESFQKSLGILCSAKVPDCSENVRRLFGWSATVCAGGVTRNPSG
jgi:hypothetical protein